MIREVEEKDLEEFLNVVGADNIISSSIVYLT